MIEAAHRRAFKIASELANSALDTGDFQAVNLRTSQMGAIAKLEEARRKIFTDVPDLSENEASLQLQPSDDFQRFMERIPARVRHAIERKGISSIDQLRTMSDDEMLLLRNFGKKSLIRLRNALANYTRESS